MGWLGGVLVMFMSEDICKHVSGVVLDEAEMGMLRTKCNLEA